ncbi:MAG: M23 family metallopeptidase [Bacillota bacterium]|nr:M23 family metallopeptidase [Bacillota bacterium]
MNNKVIFKIVGSVGKRIISFFKESGFYIAIVVGLCALAAGAVFFSTNQILTDPDQDLQDNRIGSDNNEFSLIDDFPEIPDFDQSSINDGNGTGFADDGPDNGLIAYEDIDPDDETILEDDPGEGSESTTGQEDATEQTVDQDDEAAQTTSGGIMEDGTAPVDSVVLAIVKPNFSVPVEGKVQSSYSMDRLVFSPTFNEWRTHSGVDISAPRGEVVRAIGNGVIHEIKNDPRYGFTIVIDHNNGYKSLYANLASDNTMTVGKEVKMGDAIGSVGATAIFESAEPTHLHFELYKEDKLVDPEAYIDFPK